MLDVDVVAHMVAHAALSGRRSILIVRSIAAFVAAVTRRASLVRAKGGAAALSLQHGCRCSMVVAAFGVILG